MSEQKRGDGIPIWLMSLIALAIVFGLWIGGAYYMWDRFEDAERGAAGDSFGGITALFSGLAFAALIVTLVMQRRELELQREELSDTREVMKGQSKHIERQNFEATFFRMIEHFTRIIESFSESGTGPNENRIGRPALTGREKMEQRSRILRSRLKLQDTRAKEGREEYGIDEKIDDYIKIYDSAQGDLGPYFRLLFNILKFIDRSPAENKSDYSNIIRAQLSVDELQLLAMNCVSDHGKDKMRKYVEDYSMLKHLDPEFKSLNPDVINAFKPSAFGNSEP